MDVVDWFRAELEADRAEIAAMTPADYGRSLVDTLLAPGLYLRSTVHACVYAMYYGERGASTTVSLFARPIDAPPWRPRDDIQASVWAALLVGLVVTPYVALPNDPLLAGFVTMQAVPLVADPFVAIAEVAG